MLVRLNSAVSIAHTQEYCNSVAFVGLGWIGHKESDEISRPGPEPGDYTKHFQLGGSGTPSEVKRAGIPRLLLE